MTIFYKKEVSKNGKVKYVAMGEYDPDVMDSFPYGAHLVIVEKGCTSRKYNIDPDFASVLAAAKISQDIICKEILTASEMQPKSIPLTVGQKRAWENLQKEFGEDMYTLTTPSAYAISEKIILKLVEESAKILTNPSLKKCWDNFQRMAELSI